MTGSKSLIQIALNLKRIRVEKQLTQAEVATKADINVNYYAKIERAESMPSLATLEKIIRTLKTTSSDVLPF